MIIRNGEEIIIDYCEGEASYKGHPFPLPYAHHGAELMTDSSWAGEIWISSIDGNAENPFYPYEENDIMISDEICTAAIRCSISLEEDDYLEIRDDGIYLMPDNYNIHDLDACNEWLPLKWDYEIEDFGKISNHIYFNEELFHNYE